jgi:hypothetical protein
MTRELTYAEYQEIVAMKKRVNEIHNATHDLSVAGLCDSFSDMVAELELVHEQPHQEQAAREEAAHHRSESRQDKYV